MSAKTQEHEARQAGCIQKVIGNTVEFVATGGVQETVNIGVHLAGYGIGSLAGTIIRPVRSAAIGIARGFMDNA